MDNPIAHTHRQRQLQLRQKYDNAIDAGEYYALSYPYGYIIVIIILGYLTTPGSKSGPNHGRFLAWFLSVGFCLYEIAHTRARYPVAGAFTGLFHAWLALWATAHFLVNDPKREYFRIEKVVSLTIKNGGKDSNIAITSSHDLKTSKEPLKLLEQEVNSIPAVSYIWEGFPENDWKERIQWGTDLVANLNGMGWNWAVRSTPAPPKTVRVSLAQQNDKFPLSQIWEKSKASLNGTKEEFQSSLLLQFVINYIVLDIVKTLMSLDPYFWGYTDHPAPPYLPTTWQHSSILCGLIRSIVALNATYWAVAMVLRLRPLYYMFVHDQKTLGIKEDTWMYPDDFGPYSAVWQYGLGGFWSTFWHQSFRYVFEAPAILVIRNTTIDPKGFQARVIRIFVSFICSGFMHYSLSYTSIAPSRPFLGSFMFFFLQPFGILAQYYWLRYFRSSTFSKSCPLFFCYAANLIYVNAWLCLTAPLFIKDIAAGGWFLFEPVPISIFRGLGFGAADDGWWTLHGRFLSWRFDGWRTGFVS